MQKSRARKNDRPAPHGGANIRLLLLLGGSVAAGGVGAQSPVIEEIITLGTRVEGRLQVDSAAPVDIIQADNLQHYGDSDLNNLLRSQIPSFNVNTHPISDAATIIRPAHLRGLPPDNTLVLVNGKRRHRAAVIVFLGGGLSDGSQGADISSIPTIALKHVEVLRDGASALYGSDAIAGVINFSLRDARQGGSIQAKTASTASGDGDQVTVAGNLGLPLTDAGFLNLSLEWRDQQRTVRSVQRDDAAALAAAGNPHIPDPAAVWGQPKVEDDIKFFLNAGIELAGDAELYGFGSYNSRTTDSGFYYRNPDERPGVFGLEVLRDPGLPTERVGYDRLVADVTSDGSGNCPVAGTADALDVEDATGLAAVMADPDCFVFNELFPGGFTPGFRGDLRDYSVALGLRGQLFGGVDYDLSANTGENRIDFYMYNTVNASLGPDSPTRFTPGSYVQREHNVNLDFSWMRQVADLPLHLGAGAEAREEIFEVLQGDPASWQAGPYTAQGFSIGTNGFPGFGPEVTGRFRRDNVALYLDAELEATENLRFGTAVRWEEYSSFGSTLNYKLSAFYRDSDNLAFRSTWSTGFRAPTPGQANITNVTAAYEGGIFVNRGTIPPTNPIALLKGGQQLQPEESTNFTLGTLVSTREWDFVADYFYIELRDRITLSASHQLSEAERLQLIGDGISGADSLSFFRFYTNDFATRTQGVDFSASHAITDATGLRFNVNWTQTKVSEHNPETMDATRIRMIEENIPRVRGSATLNHSGDRWQGMLRANYFGAFWEAHLGDATMPTSGGAEWTVDLELSYRLTDVSTVAFGAENLFDNYPDLNDARGLTGSRYPASAPMGINGGLYYLRVNHDF